jgi:hypothetical protein
MKTSQAQRSVSRKVPDLFYLVGIALLVCALGIGAFAVADIRHINPLWVFLLLVSLGFLAFAFEAYRNEFRSPRFVFFVVVWLAVNLAVLVFVGSFGWVYLAPALLLEQFLFYMTAYWLFGLLPPLPSTAR